jgi:uncharacterized protein HemX
MNNNNDDPATNRHGKRTDDVEIRFPFGMSVKATGRVVASALLVLALGIVVVYHDYKNTQQNTATIEALAVISYVLTLTDSERKALRLEMPDLLREKLRVYERRQEERKANARP